MCRVTFLEKDVEINVKRGTKLIDCIREAGLNIEAPCNGSGKCGKCKVKAFGKLSLKNEEEKKHTESEFIRLACIAEVEGDVSIELIEKKKDLKTINRGFSIDIDICSGFKKIELSTINEKNFRPYIYGLQYEVKSASVIRKIGLLEKEGWKEVKGVVFNNTLIDLDKKIERILGAAIDIGTTGLSAYLVDLENGEVLKKVSALNPQTEYGGDVLSRITFSMDKDNGSDLLSSCIRRKIGEMLKDLVEDDYAVDNIYRVTIAANTTMLHLLLGVKANSIAKAPYRSVFLDKLDFKSRDLEININEEGIVTLLPSASSYIGADILAGVIAIDFQSKDHASLFIDIGTNGELVAIADGKMAASSTAAGPALEGMNIDCGMRAEEGALDRFNIDEEFDIIYSTIGEKEPIGICGSGLIDIAAALVKRGIVLPSGRFNKDIPEKLKYRLVDKRFYITDKVYISQKDIRQIQLAKGAIASGIEMLLKQIDISIDSIKEVVIAGAFGYHIDAESIKIIGLIPKGFTGDMTFVGNSSVEGARIALINEYKLQEISDIRKNMKIIELSTREDFQKYFVKALNF